ncbi:MAG: T9SS type A sorting domain-containing protein [Bacteroidales bacterium]|nr:T9SS type A sorting domain-containing protein [Bacteroidales bacterium]
MKKLYFSFIFILLSISLSAQILTTHVNTLGGTLNDYARCLYPLNNSSFIFAGNSYSTDGDLTVNNGSSDCWFVQFDTTLSVLNSVSFGESGSETIKDVHVLNDTSFVFLIESNSTTGVFSTNNGGVDVWIRTHYLPDWLSPAIPFGGSSNDFASSIVPKSSGGYLICGSSTSNDGHLSGNFGQTDFWALNLSPTYSVVWSKNFGGSSYDEAVKIFQLDDGNILVFGNTNSNDNMISDFGGVKDVWVLKLNSLGDTLWTKTYGGNGYDEIVTVKQLDNGHFALIGNSNSSNGDFFYVKNQEEKLSNSFGFYHVINADGQFVFGANKVIQNNNIFFQDMVFTNQQNVEIFGHLDTDTNELITNDDILILNFSNGIITKADTFGGNSADAFSYLYAHGLSETDFLVVASTFSNDLTNDYMGANDVLLAILRKSNSSGIDENKMLGFSIFPNPVSDFLNVSLQPNGSSWNYVLTDITGKPLTAEQQLDNDCIDVSFLSKGMYILVLTNTKLVMAQRFIKVE